MGRGFGLGGFAVVKEPRQVGQTLGVGTPLGWWNLVPQEGQATVAIGLLRCLFGAVSGVVDLTLG